MEDLKKANLGFHYSERLKSNFLIVARLFSLEKNKLESGKEVLQAALQGLRGELGIAGNQIGSSELKLAELRLQ